MTADAHVRAETIRVVDGGSNVTRKLQIWENLAGLTIFWEVAAFAEGATLWYMMLRCRAVCPSEMQCGLGTASSRKLPSDPMLTCSCSASAVTHRRAERG